LSLLARVLCSLQSEAGRRPCGTARLVAVFEFEFEFEFGQGRTRVRLRPDHGATAGCSPTAEGRDGARPPFTAEGSKPLKDAKQR
jgi:hypothetical protein